MPNKMLKYMQKNIVHKMPDKIPENILKYMPEDITNRMPD
jgi:cellobiose-specific phosphotransferase system component IIC